MEEEKEKEIDESCQWEDNRYLRVELLKRDDDNADERQWRERVSEWSGKKIVSDKR